MKLGDKVRVSKECEWYKDVGDSIGTLVAIPYNGDYDYAILFRYEDFVNGDSNYKLLHNCELREYMYSYHKDYYEEDFFDGNFVVLKGELMGYRITKRYLIPIKKGNTNVFIGK